MCEVERHAEEEAPPGERRHDRVDADRRGRDRQREEDGDERWRRADQQLEGALPALPLDRTARPEQGRRPDAHQARAQRDVEERARLVARLDHEERDRGEDDRLQHGDEHEEERVRQRLHVEEPAHPEQARAHGLTVAIGRPRDGRADRTSPRGSVGLPRSSR